MNQGMSDMCKKEKSIIFQTKKLQNYIKGNDGCLHRTNKIFKCIQEHEDEKGADFYFFLREREKNGQFIITFDRIFLLLWRKKRRDRVVEESILTPARAEGYNIIL